MDMTSLHVLLVLCLAVHTVCPVPVRNTDERDPAFWNAKADEELQNALKHNNPIVGVAKNVIIFLGDGMGVTTVTAGRILAGQLKGQKGEEYQLSFEKFPNVALSKTYAVDYQTPDSASTATAYLCGVKSNFATLGVSAHAKQKNCASSKDAHLDSILKWSLAEGKSAGVVTTTRVTHATPAASYANTPARDWEGKVDPGQEDCKDIAQQLVRENPDINVILGGGRRNFLPFNSSDPEAEGGYMTNGREDDLNLVDEWLSTQSNRSRQHQYVWNQTGFDSVDPANTDYLLGLFEPSHMQFELDRHKDKAGEPSLAAMTEKAINILKKNDKGFFLLVEGGRIDMGHHESNAIRALHDTVAFADAVDKATDMLNDQDTLIVVTADHSHAFAFAGYPVRGNDILGLVRYYNLTTGTEQLTLGSDGKPYTTLVYGNGPGGNGLNNGMNGRQDLTSVNTSDQSYQQQAIVPKSYETHGGEDVAIYARGPMAHLFHGVHEQNYIAHVMAYASCVGDYSQDGKCARALVQTDPNGPLIG